MSGHLPPSETSPSPQVRAAPGGLEPSRRCGIVHLTADLVLTSRVSQLCRQRQIPYRVIPRLAKLGDSIPATLLIDLQAPGWNPSEYRDWTRTRPLADRTIAYAQHVETQLLATAAELGFTAVLTRGQFDARCGDWLSG